MHPVTLQVLVEHLRQKCLEEHVDKNVQPVKGYSVLNQAPKEWELDQHQPCGSERSPSLPGTLCGTNLTPCQEL